MNISMFQEKYFPLLLSAFPIQQYHSTFFRLFQRYSADFSVFFTMFLHIFPDFRQNTRCEHDINCAKLLQSAIRKECGIDA